ncbi:MAG: NAD(P)H-hydrate epimerase [Acidimicrobiia bacterium]|nr:NAD(P)H-hydrate epimerase [Acidimicrobiia bacterium]
MSFPRRPLVDVPAVTTDQMREVDRLMIEGAGISLLQMMENAGRSLAAVVLARYPEASITILAGKGGNGGGGLVAARHLANRGASVTVVMGADDLSPVAAHQFSIVKAMGVPLVPEPVAADVVVDALVGYSLRGAPRGRTAELIGWANESPGQVVALDMPSGVDSTTGETPGAAVSAGATMTIALPKTGLVASDLAGHLYLTDISVPQSVYATLGVEVPADLFTQGQVLRLT